MTLDLWRDGPRPDMRNIREKSTDSNARHTLQFSKPPQNPTFWRSSKPKGLMSLDLERDDFSSRTLTQRHLYISYVLLKEWLNVEIREIRIGEKCSTLHTCITRSWDWWNELIINPKPASGTQLGDSTYIPWLPSDSRRRSGLKFLVINWLEWWRLSCGVPGSFEIVMYIAKISQNECNILSMAIVFKVDLYSSLQQPLPRTPIETCPRPPCAIPF